MGVLFLRQRNLHSGSGLLMIKSRDFFWFFFCVDFGTVSFWTRGKIGTSFCFVLFDQ